MAPSKEVVATGSAAVAAIDPDQVCFPRQCTYAASLTIPDPQGVQGSFGTHQKGFQAKGRRV